MVKFITYGLVALGGVVAYRGYSKFADGRRKLNAETHLVVVGGGYGGCGLATNMQKRGKCTLIDPKDALAHNMAFPRAAVSPGFSEKTFIPYKPTFGDNFVQGRVTGVDSKNQKVILDDGAKEISYTKLVFATGSRGYFPGKCDDSKSSSFLKQKFDDYANMIAKAKSIIIVGGGAVGIEMAGEIADFYPDCKVTVIHNGNKIVGKDLLPKSEEMLLKHLKEMNVNLIFEDKVKNLASLPLNTLQDKITVETEKGSELSANMVIPCIGLRVNSEAYADSLPESVNDQGQLKVDSNLKVIGHDNIFAVGDCNDVKCVKLGTQAQDQVQYLEDALLRIDEGKALESYSPATMKMVVPLGTKHGIAQFGSRVMGDFFAKKIKGNDVFVKMIWGIMGQPVPPTEEK